MWRSGNSSTQLVGMKTGAATMENSTEALKKLKIDLPCDPAIPLLGTHPEKTHGRRSLVGCSPWGHTESDTTEVT